MSEGSVSVSAQSDRTTSLARETLQLEGSGLSEQESPTNRTQVQSADLSIPPTQNGPTPAVIDFLPYPNDGESAFKRKYEGMDLNAMAGAVLTLRQRLNEEVDKLAEERYAQGLVEERIYPSSDAANADGRPRELPQGMGEVWPCERMSTQADGSIKRWTIYLTQDEHPELFAHKSESIWVAHAYKHKQKQAGGH
jgi:hypothetical protein